MLHNGPHLADTFICGNESHKTLRRVAGLLHVGSAPSAVNCDGQKSNCKNHTSPRSGLTPCVSYENVYFICRLRVVGTFTTPDHGAKMGGKSKSHSFEEEVLNRVGEGEKWQSRSILFVTKAKLPI